MKKLAVIGKGTAGSLAVPHFLRWTNWEIDWYYDPKIKAQAVGEGSTTLLPFELSNNLNFEVEELEQIYGTYKGGIKKVNWGSNGNSFIHPFFNGSVGYHFNAIKLQELIFKKIQSNSRVNLIETYIDHDTIDSDFILDCSGAKSIDHNFVTSDFIPVNSAYVTQCYWTGIKFMYTLAIARPYGWVFGIPLLNRCSIGYMFNNTINSIEEIKEDVQNIFKEYDLIPSDDTNTLTFKNYYRKLNYNGRVCYNGNSSFFLEPLEATSIHFMSIINRLAFSAWVDNYPTDLCNKRYDKIIKEIESIIMLHYAAGSKFNTKFWDVANEKGNKNFREFLSNYNIRDIISADNNENTGIGTWSSNSFKINLKGLELFEKIDKGFFK